jgi:glutamyl-tRNA synthetase
MPTTQIKSRFCPSPTGLLHLGNVRTALFNALFAYGAQGTFLLRIEDTDKARSKTEYTQKLQEDLQWLGLDWQEGPGKDGGNGPYYQSERQPIYDQYYGQLEQQGIAYLCFCTEQQLALTRKIQLAAKRPPRYAGTCRDLTKEQIAEKLVQNGSPTLRFRVPDNQVVSFVDAVRGEQRFNTQEIGDFIIRRADGTSPFMFCNAIDDALMGVTHALRGEDHLTNTPRQLLILQALGLPVPTYGHISLIVGPDGTPLSKRHGSRSVQEMQAEGFFPIAVVNYLARLGHHYENEAAFMSFTELAQQFRLDALGRAPARFDNHQLLYWQKEAVSHMDIAILWQWMGEKVHQLVPAEVKDAFVQAIKPNIVFPGDALRWAEIFFKGIEYQHEHKLVLQTAGQAFFDNAIAGLDKMGHDFKTVSNYVANTMNIRGKALFQPFRVALTGETHGPEMVHIFELLGSAEIANRLEKAKAACP